jgi:hypothetical protein
LEGRVEMLEELLDKVLKQRTLDRDRIDRFETELKKISREGAVSIKTAKLTGEETEIMAQRAGRLKVSVNATILVSKR